MPKVTNDDLEHKLDGIKAALGIQTTTTSSVLDNIKSDLDEIKGKLTEADRKFRMSLWVTVLMPVGISLVVSGMVGGVSVLAAIDLAHAKNALDFCISIVILGVAMVIGLAMFVCFKVHPLKRDNHSAKSK